VSELLDRVRREIRERLELARAAVLEYERLQAALHPLGDAELRATRAVRGGGRGSRASESARSSRAAAKSSSTRARTSERRSAASGSTKRPGRDRAGAASASAGRSPGAAGAGRGQRRTGAGGRAASAPAEKRAAVRAGAAAPPRKRAARGANRDALLGVVGERPGVTARELAAASRVTGGTLYTRLRRLTDDGTLDKRELPGGQTGYALATSAAAAAQPAPTQSQAPTREAGAGAESPPSERPGRDRADSTNTTDAPRSAPADKHPI
jgi:hypothetical protein